MRVVVTGSECTGKTTLAADLAAYFGTIAISEYVREWVDRKGVVPAVADLPEIAAGQRELERRRSPGHGELVIQDTDLLSTIVYSRHYFGHCPRALEDALRQAPGDLYLLAGIDVPWVPDGLQRDRGERREEMQDLFSRALEEFRLRSIAISGTREQRLRTAARHVEQLQRQSGSSAAKGSREPIKPDGR